MPSTPESLLRTELQATGENATTWGIKTNNNIELLAEAIAGTANVNVGGSGNYTLTASNYVSDEARPATLVLTGTLTGNRDVIVPTTPKHYTVLNQTSGAFTLTIRQSAGTGVAIPPGSTLIVCTSTTCVEVNATPKDASVTTPKLADANVTTPKLADASVTTAKLAFDGGPLSGMRNRIINGDMRIDQRNAGASVTPVSGSTFVLDRFSFVASQSSKLSVQQNAGSVTPPAGFTNYLGFTSLSAYSILSSDYFTTQQAVEGFNAADFAWGTASAIPVTLSFFVRSSLTGTFGGGVYNSAANRSYPFIYTISAANTWEYKSITIPGDTSGTWLTNNGAGLRINWGLGVGATDSGTAGVWANALYRSATGATSVVGTNGATFYITGVQLEPGTVATPFERRQYGQELALCQRYFARSGQINITNPTAASVTITGRGSFPVTMRASPTLTATNGAGLTVAENRDIGLAVVVNGFQGYSTGTISGNAEL